MRYKWQGRGRLPENRSKITVNGLEVCCVVEADTTEGWVIAHYLNAYGQRQVDQERERGAQVLYRGEVKVVPHAGVTGSARDFQAYALQRQNALEEAGLIDYKWSGSFLSYAQRVTRDPETALDVTTQNHMSGS